MVCLVAVTISIISAAHAEPLHITAIPVSLASEEPARTRVGALTYRAGFELTSVDPRFGGLSGLTLGLDGDTLIAVTDRGQWLRFFLNLDAAGTLTGIGKAEIFPILGPNGAPLRSKRHGDAEAVTRAADGALLVAFEGRARLWRFAGKDPLLSVAEPRKLPSAIARLRGNDGLEAVQTLPDGRLVLITEGARIGDAVRGWVIGGARDTSLTYPYDGYFQPTDAALLDAETLLVLERGFSLFAGPAARVMRVSIADLIPGARLRPREVARLRAPLIVDNFEGLAVTRAPQGIPLLYLVSDDNFNMLQRTLLLQFALE